jgi:hypothetical protein
MDMKLLITKVLVLNRYVLITSILSHNLLIPYDIPIQSCLEWNTEIVFNNIFVSEYSIQNYLKIRDKYLN